MALGFQNAPVDWRTMQAGQVRTGELMGQGAQQGVQAIMQGMQQAAAERKRKEEEKRMAQVLEPLVQQMSGGQVQLRDAPKDAWPLLFKAAQEMQQEQAEAPVRALQQKNAELQQTLMQMRIEAAKREPQEQARVRDFLLAAAAQIGRENPRAAQIILEGQGDPQVIEALLKIDQATGGGRGPSRVGQVFRPGEPGAAPYIHTQEGTVTPLQMGRSQETKEPEVFTIGGRELTFYAGKVFDEQGQVVSGSGERPMDMGTAMTHARIADDIAKAEMERAQHLLEINRGDNRTGLANIKSRKDEVEKLDAQIARLKRLLDMMRGGSGGAAAPGAGMPTPAEIAAEMQRRRAAGQ
jgi:hypothetical protein